MSVNLRHYRKQLNITMKELADITDLSIGYISQMERGLVEPSLSSLRKIANALEIPLYLLLTEEERPTEIMTIRQQNRLVLRNQEDSVLYEMLTPLPSEQFIPKSVVIRFTIKPHAQVTENLISHPSEEVITILSGEMVLCVGEQETTLYPGDSSVIRNDFLHNFRNDSDVDVVGISCITPPVWGNARL